jgi:hypothetical protein
VAAADRKCLLSCDSRWFFLLLAVCGGIKLTRASVWMQPRDETSPVSRTSERCISASTVPLRTGSPDSSGSMFPKTRRDMGQFCLSLLACDRS